MIATISGKKVHYLDIGSGRPVILLHGYLENISMWSSITDMLSKEFRVISIDLAGHGKSDPLEKDLSIQHMASLVNDLLKSLSIKKASFVGHSMGGYVGLAIINDHPDRVEKLILLHSKSSADSHETKLKRDQGIVMLQQHPNLYIKESINNLFWEKDKSRNKEAILNLIEEAKKGNLKGYSDALTAMKNRPDLRNLLKSHKNILFIAGNKDPVIPIETSHSEMRLLDEKFQFILEKSGHMGFIEERELCEKMIINGLKV